jgi:uncharacterized membrane protein YidH (DUF202 family)
VRGRATRVALPALIVFALVAVVAVAATGSVPRGSNEARAPSATFLDTLFTLWIVAVVAGGVLLVYGLMQRKAIARQIASGRYPRFTLASFLVSVGVLVVVVWLFKNPEGRTNVDEEGLFGGSTLRNTPTDTEQIRSYEPSVSWISIAVVVGLIVVAAIAFVTSRRRARRGRTPRIDLAQELAVVLDDTLDDLRAESDPRRAIIAAYARLERVLAVKGVARRESETPDEYLVRVLGGLELTPDAICRLTALFTEAKFSHHDVDSTMKESAIGALEQVRDELRALRDRTDVLEPQTQAATS